MADPRPMTTTTATPDQSSASQPRPPARPRPRPRRPPARPGRPDRGPLPRSRRAIGPWSPPATRSWPGRRSPSACATRASSSSRRRDRRRRAGRATAGRRPASPAARLRRGPAAETGELLYEHGGHWALAAGEHAEPIECPLAGVVRDVRPGIGIRVRAQGRALLGVEALGDPTSGRLSLGSERSDQRHGRLRSTSLDVGLAGTILVIGSRVDAEALTRARAMGVRGVIVSGLAGKERRDFMASEARQRAALHRLPPVRCPRPRRRRPAPDRRPGGRGARGASRAPTVAITVDPPAIVFDEPGVTVDPPPADHVRVRSGEHAGEEGRWAGLAGVRRFAGGTFLEAGWVVFGDDPPVSIPIADLERFA